MALLINCFGVSSYLKHINKFWDSTEFLKVETVNIHYIYHVMAPFLKSMALIFQEIDFFLESKHFVIIAITCFFIAWWILSAAPRICLIAYCLVIFLRALQFWFWMAPYKSVPYPNSLQSTHFYHFNDQNLFLFLKILCQSLNSNYVDILNNPIDKHPLLLFENVH